MYMLLYYIHMVIMNMVPTLRLANWKRGPNRPRIILQHNNETMYDVDLNYLS